MKWFAGISIALNLALLFAWWRTGGGASGEITAPPVSQTTLTRTRLVTNVVDAVATNTFTVPVFQWAMIESESFEEYMANLRRLDCPEWLVKEILLAELMRYYELRETVLELARPAFHWATYHEQRQLQHDFEEARLNLMQEERDVMLQLTGSFRSGDAAGFYDDTGVLALIVGGFGYEQGLDCYSEISFQQEQSKAFESIRDGFFTRADQAELEQSYERMKVLAAERGSPALFDEFWLRVQLVASAFQNDFDPGTMQLTGSQLRQLIRIRSAYIDPIRHEFTRENPPRGAELDRLNLLVHEQLRLELGEGVAADYARGQDPAFREIHNFATDQQLPRQTAITLFDIRQAASNELNNLMSNPDLNSAQKNELRQLIWLETEKELRVKLGPAVFETYRQQHAQWFNQLGARDPFASLNLPNLEVPQ
jgi:hypothetical protein